MQHRGRHAGGNVRGNSPVAWGSAQSPRQTPAIGTECVPQFYEHQLKNGGAQVSVTLRVTTSPDFAVPTINKDRQRRRYSVLPFPPAASPTLGSTAAMRRRYRV